VVDKNYLVEMKDFLEQLLVVLVIYEMKIEESPAYHSLTCALLDSNVSTSLFIYDNSWEPHDLPSNPIWSNEYYHDPSNPGVGKAYNEGFRFASEKNKKWILLVDQDTLFPTNCFDEYFRAAKEHRITVPILRDDIGIVSPLRFYFGGGQRVKGFGRTSVLELQDFLFHNSGLLVATQAFERAGGYDENLRLDFSDLAFVHRLRLHDKEFAIANFSCTHRLATSGAAPLDERLLRFESYVRSAKYFKRKYATTDRFLLPRILLRSIKLCLQYRTFKFMTPFFGRT